MCHPSCLYWLRLKSLVKLHCMESIDNVTLNPFLLLLGTFSLVFFWHKTVGKIPTVTFSFIYVQWLFTMGKWENYKMSSHVCMPSFELGLALCLTIRNFSLNSWKMPLESLMPLLNMILFLWFHKAQHPRIRTSLKQIVWRFCSPVAISMSISWSSWFHSPLSTKSPDWKGKQRKDGSCIRWYHHHIKHKW